jgi:hypothetical protein
MTSLRHALESFYDRVRPLGVAFVGPPRLAAGFGRPPATCSWMWEGRDGFLQYHLEESDLSVYVSSFGWGKVLIAQFRFQQDCPPPAEPWLAFVRLASAIARVIDSPDDAEDSGITGVPVPGPHPAPPGGRAAEAPLGVPLAPVDARNRKWLPSP